MTVRKVSWMGYTWTPKVYTTKVNPGPNYYSDSTDNVWVDASGYLHLAVVKDAGGLWQNTELHAKKLAGKYGLYEWKVLSDVRKLGKNVVLGLFTYDWGEYTPGNGEIDIEFSHWGDADDAFALNLTVQGQGSKTFQPGPPPYDVSFLWEADYVTFKSVNGKGQAINYKLPSIAITPTTWPFMDLWMMKGYPPAGHPQVVLESFTFTASA